ncbi:MAG: hypothetical protein JF599_11295 [Verrucomicrobia bacterium]|nr:hypothetical protein [Verrucomicrobiota bacterium]
MNLRVLLGVSIALLAALLGWRILRHEHVLAPARADAVGGVAAHPAAQVRLSSAGRAPSASTPDFSAVKAQVLRKLAAWRGESDELRRDALLAELLALLTDENVGEIVRALSPEWLATPFGEISLRRWAALDHLAAATWLATVPGVTDYQAGLVVYGWLGQDRTGFHAYLATLPEGAWKQDVLKIVTNDALLLKDGAEAIDLLLRQPAAGQRDEMLGWAATEWARQDPVRAAEWARQIADPALQARLFGAVTVGYAWKEPQQAAELLVASAPREGVDRNVLSSVMNIWSPQAPAAAAGWVTEHLAGADQLLAIRSVLTAWGYADFTAAQNWTSNLSAGPLRDQAERTLRKVAAAHEGREIGD